MFCIADGISVSEVVFVQDSLDLFAYGVLLDIYIPRINTHLPIVYICCRMYKIFITNESMDKIRRFAFFSASSRIYIATQTTKHSGDRLKTYIHSLMYLYISNMCDMSFQRMIADWICGRIGKNHAYISSVKIHKMLFTFKTFYLFE